MGCSVSHSGDHDRLKRTRIDNNLIPPFQQLVIVIAAIQLSKCRQTRSTHPVMEMLVVTQVRGRIVTRVPIREPQTPVRGWDDF